MTARESTFNPRQGFVCQRRFPPHVVLAGHGDGVVEENPTPTCPTSKLVPVEFVI